MILMHHIQTKKAVGSEANEENGDFRGYYDRRRQNARAACPRPPPAVVRTPRATQCGCSV